MSAAQRPQSANIGISARNVEDLTESMSARRERRVELEPHAKHPHYTHGLLWDNEDDVLRVPHGYGNTRGVSKTGNAGTGTVLDFGTPRTPCTRTAVSRVFTG